MRRLVAAADLSGADLRNVSLTVADLHAANSPGELLQHDHAPAARCVTNAPTAQPTCRSCTGRRSRSRLRLPSTRCPRANVRRALLTLGNLSFADFSGADFTGTDLTEAILTGAKTPLGFTAGATFCNTSMPDGTVANQQPKC